MKTKQVIFLISILFAIGNLSAQNTSKFLNLETSVGLAFNHQNLSANAGLHLSIGAHLTAGFFLATDPMGYQEIKSITTVSDQTFSSANINHRPVYGFEIKYYRHKNQRSIFLGSGIYRGAYKIDAFSFTEKDHPITSNIGGNIFGPIPETYKEYHQTTTRNEYYGITTELGYLFPVKNGKFEASFRLFNPLYSRDGFEIYEEDPANSNQKISVKENFRTVSGNFQLKYVRVF